MLCKMASESTDSMTCLEFRSLIGQPPVLQYSDPGGTGIPEQHVRPLQHGMLAPQCAVEGAQSAGQQLVQLGS